jgi:hypothetical protein
MTAERLTELLSAAAASTYGGYRLPDDTTDVEYDLVKAIVRLIDDRIAEDRRNKSDD